MLICPLCKKQEGLIKQLREKIKELEGQIEALKDARIEQDEIDRLDY